MAIMSDFYNPPASKAEPVHPKVEPCLLEFLRRLNSRFTESVTSIDPKLLIPGWPEDLNCSLDDCVHAALEGEYATKTHTGLSITQKGIELASS
jgi:hypothetical protein